MFNHQAIGMEKHLRSKASHNMSVRNCPHNLGTLNITSNNHLSWDIHFKFINLMMVSDWSVSLVFWWSDNSRRTLPVHSLSWKLSYKVALLTNLCKPCTRTQVLKNNILANKLYFSNFPLDTIVLKRLFSFLDYKKTRNVSRNRQMGRNCFPLWENLY